MRQLDLLEKLTGAFNWRSGQAGAEDVEGADLTNKCLESALEDGTDQAENGEYSSAGRAQRQRQRRRRRQSTVAEEAGYMEALGR